MYEYEISCFDVFNNSIDSNIYVKKFNYKIWPHVYKSVREKKHIHFDSSRLAKRGDGIVGTTLTGPATAEVRRLVVPYNI